MMFVVLLFVKLEAAGRLLPLGEEIRDAQFENMRSMPTVGFRSGRRQNERIRGRARAYEFFFCFERNPFLLCVARVKGDAPASVV